MNSASWLPEIDPTLLKASESTSGGIVGTAMVSLEGACYFDANEGPPICGPFLMGFAGLGKPVLISLAHGISLRRFRLSTPLKGNGKRDYI